MLSSQSAEPSVVAVTTRAHEDCVAAECVPDVKLCLESFITASLGTRD